MPVLANVIEVVLIGRSSRPAMSQAGPVLRDMQVLQTPDDRFDNLPGYPFEPSMFLQAVAGPLSADVLAAYDAPLPDRAFNCGLRQMIALIPLTRNDPGAAIGRTAMAALGRWEKPFLTAYFDGDPATRGWETVFQQHRFTSSR